MNKQELLDKAVHELNGVLPMDIDGVEACSGYYIVRNDCLYLRGKAFICYAEEFQQRAKELGYINGYRWGVEYPTNGKKPDLPDDVAISWLDEYETWCGSMVGNLKWSKYHGGFIDIEKFKITDQRYKPADTSYLDAPKAEQAEPDGWFDYETQKALRLPPVGDKSVSYLAGDGVWIGCEVAAHYNSGAIVAHNDGFTLVYMHELRPNNFHARKAEAERKRVVKAAVAKWLNCKGDVEETMYQMYDAGCLRLPADKS